MQKLTSRSCSLLSNVLQGAIHAVRIQAPKTTGTVRGPGLYAAGATGVCTRGTRGYIRECIPALVAGDKYQNTKHASCVRHTLLH